MTTPDDSRPKGSTAARILRAILATMAAGAIAGLWMGGMFYWQSQLKLYTDYLLILSYAALAAAIVTAVPALPLAILLRKSTKLVLLPSLFLAFYIFAFPASKEASLAYLLQRANQPPNWGHASGTMAIWLAIAVASAAVLRFLLRAPVAIKCAAAAALLAAFHVAYFNVRDPGWPDYRPTRDAPPRTIVPVKTQPAPPILAFCVDGGDWEFVDPLLKAGKLPNLQKLIQGGMRTTLRSDPPFASPPCWTSILTGKNMDRHYVRGHLYVDLPGVSYFRLHWKDRDNIPFMAAGSAFVATGLLQLVPAPSFRRQADPIWKVFSQQGRKVWVLGVPGTWPAEPVNGSVMSDRVYYSVWEMFYRHQDGIPRGTYPPELFNEIDPLVRRPRQVTADEIRRFYDPTDADLNAVEGDAIGVYQKDFRALFNRTYCMDRTVLDVFDHLADKGPLPDLAVVYVTMPDFASHVFLPYSFPEKYPQGFTTPTDQARYGTAFAHCWEYIDARLGAILRRYEGKVTVAVLSDHGNDATPGNLIWPGWHGAEGMFLLNGPGIRAGISEDPVTLYDVTPTLYAAGGFPVPEDVDGRCREDFFTQTPRTGTVPTYDLPPQQ